MTHEPFGNPQVHGLKAEKLGQERRRTRRTLEALGGKPGFWLNIPNPF